MQHIERIGVLRMSCKKLILSFLLICLLFPFAASAEDIATLTKKAANGDLDSQLTIAEHYLKQKDIDDAVIWYQKAAEQGDRSALSFMLWRSIGVIMREDTSRMLGLGTAESGEMDEACGKLIYWSGKCESAGYALSPTDMYYVALCYYEGRGVEKNAISASKWFTRAAEKRHEESVAFLGMMYGNGDSVPIDLLEACKWYNVYLSISADPFMTKRIRESMDRTYSLMTPTEINEARRLAKDWLVSHK